MHCKADSCNMHLKIQIEISTLVETNRAHLRINIAHTPMHAQKKCPSPLKLIIKLALLTYFLSGTHLILSSLAQLLQVLLLSSSVRELDTTFTSGTKGLGERESPVDLTENSK